MGDLRAVPFLRRRRKSAANATAAAPHVLAATRMLAGLAALAVLAACAGEAPVAGLAPPNPDVPQAAPDAFPTLGTTRDASRPPPLKPAERDKLEKELEALAKKRERELKKALESDG